VPASQREDRIAELLRRQNQSLNTRCGHRGLCDGCLVELIQGELINTATGATVAANGHPISVRGCEHRMASGDVQLRIPPRSLLAYEPQVVTDFRINVPVARNPLCVGEIGVAIDIGTTTVALMIVDLTNGQILGRAAGFNRQMQLGDDVLTRINLCGTDPTMLKALQQHVIEETIAPLLVEALTKAGIARERVAGFSVAANTTMLHLFAGVDPTLMGVAPFTPTFLEHRIIPAADLRLNAMPAKPMVHLLPGAAAYVGADLTAGAFASGLIYDEGPSLLVDIGTNGEIILKLGDKMYGCATAAGPAFEGAGLESGMRAGEGAISHIWFDSNPLAIRTEMIGQKHAGVKPIGICGSAYIDLLARARQAGVLTATGRFDDSAPGAADYIMEAHRCGRALRIAYGQGKHPVIVSERDISRLLQAKAAIAAGILTLLRRVNIAPADVKTLYLAGGFGMHLDQQATIACGMLPGFRPEQIQVVGNTSLAGAYLALLDGSVVAEMARVGKNMEIIELNLDPEFESCYVDQLSLAD